MDRRDTGLDFSRDRAYDAEVLAQSAEKGKHGATNSPAPASEAKEKKREKKPTGSRVTISPPSAFHETTSAALETLPPEQRAEVESAKDSLLKKRKAAMKGLRRSYSSVVSGLRIASTDDDGDEEMPDVAHRTLLQAAGYVISRHATTRVWVISLIALMALILASLALFLVPKEVASIINVRSSLIVSEVCVSTDSLRSSSTSIPIRATSTSPSRWRASGSSRWSRASCTSSAASCSVRF